MSLLVFPTKTTRKKVLLYSGKDEKVYDYFVPACENVSREFDASWEIAKWYGDGWTGGCGANDVSGASTVKNIRDGGGSPSADGLNDGINFVYGVGHGSEPGWAHLAWEGLDRNFFSSLESEGEYGIWYLYGCQLMPLGYEDGLCRHAIMNLTGGAVAVISYSVPVGKNYNGYTSHPLFFEYLLKGKEVGVADETSRNNEFLATNLFGDPAMVAWTENAQNKELTVEIEVDGAPTNQLKIGPQNVTIKVTHSGNPVEGAMVCLWKQGEAYDKKITPASGEVILYDFSPENTGIVSLRVTCWNFIPIDDEELAVISISEPYICYHSHLVNDINGNNDGIANPGETVELEITLKNTGGEIANSVETEFLTTTSGIYPSSSGNISFGNIPSGGQVTRSYSITIDPHRIWLPLSPQEVPFNINITSNSGAYNWQNEFNLYIFNDMLEHTRHRAYWDGGISKYIIDSVEVSNYGCGAAKNVVVKFKQGSNIIASINCGDIPDKSRKLATGSCEVSDISVIDNVVVEDEYRYGMETGRGGSILADTDPLLFDPPELIWNTNLGQDFVELSWDYGVNILPNNLLGYNIYRKDPGSSNYERINTFRVWIATYFRDENLIPWSNYEYAIETIDRVGNRSGTSGTFHITTNPPFQTGEWPVSTLPGEGFSSPKVADLNGDGISEVVLLCDKLYVWDKNGNLCPGWPNNDIYGTWSSPAIADIDSDGNNDIIIIARESGTDDAYVHAFKYDGTMLWRSEKIITTLWAGWSEISSPVVSNIDLYGEKEIITCFGNIFNIWGADGKKLYEVTTISGTTPAIGNIDGNEANGLEIVLLTTNGELYVLGGDCIFGDLVMWSTTLEGIAISSPAIGDIDNDGQLDVITVNKDPDDINGNSDLFIKAWHWVGGGLEQKWEKSYLHKEGHKALSSPALADLDGDGKLEIIVGETIIPIRWERKANLHILDCGGGEISSVQGKFAEVSPVVGDINGDGTQEILMGGFCHERRIHGFNLNGTVLKSAKGFPLFIGGPTRASPVITDVDLDGNLEVICNASDMKIYMWDVPEPITSLKLDWPESHHDKQNTGCCELPPSLSAEFISNVAGATVGNHQRKLQIDELGHLHLLWNNGCWILYAKSEDKGNTWPLQYRKTVGFGRYPSLAIDDQGGVNVVWKRGIIGGAKLYYRRKINTEWSEVYKIYESGSWLSSPSIAIEKVVAGDDIVHLVLDRRFFNGVESEWDARHCEFSVSDPNNVTWEIIDYREHIPYNIVEEEIASPSISIDEAQNLHVAYDIPNLEEPGGHYKIYYANRIGINNWLKTYISEGSHPFIDIHDIDIDIIYEKDNDIWLSSSPVWIPKNISETGTSNPSCLPQILDGLVIVWSELQSEGKYDICYKNWEWGYYQEGEVVGYKYRWSNIKKLTDTDENSKYPQIALKPKGIACYELNCIWTEGDNSPYEIKHEVCIIKSLLSGHITDNTLLQKDVYVAGDVTVDSGVTLTVEPGYFGHSDDQNSGKDSTVPELEVYGTLITDSAQFIISSENGKQYWRIETFGADASATFTDCFIGHEGDFLFCSNPAETKSSQISEERLVYTDNTDKAKVPMVFKFSQNEPNPFFKSTNIKYQIPVKSRVSLKVYDITGRCVKTLINSEKDIGYYTVKLDSKEFSAGIYFMKFFATNGVKEIYKETKKLILLK